MIKRSQQERFWIAGAGLVAFIVVAIGYFFFISPQRSDTDDVKGQTATAQMHNTTLQHDIAVLESQNSKLAVYQNALKQAHLALPSTSGLPEFLRSLQTLGSATSTQVTSVSVGAPANLSASNGAAPAAPSSSASSAPAPAASTSTAVSASTVYSLPITASLTGTPKHLQEFLTQLQTVQPRAVLISSIVQGGAVAAGTTTTSNASSTTLQLTMQAFMAPGLAPATSSAAAVPSASPTSATP